MEARDRRRLPLASLITLPGLGHIPQIEDTDAFNAALLETLKKR